MKSSRLWPKSIPCCLLCEASADDSFYGGRGLCSPCYRHATKRGILDKWPALKESSATGNIAKKIATLVGCTEAASHLGVSTNRFFDWATKGFPKSKKEALEKYLAKIRVWQDDFDREPLPCRHRREISPWAIRESPDIENES